MAVSENRREHRNDEIARYLLGELPAAERVALEDRFFADDDFFAQIEEGENDLIADYAHGRLSAQQRLLFEQNYLIRPDRRAHVEFITALTGALPGKKPSWRERLRALLPEFNAPLIFAGGLALLLLALGGVWLWNEMRRLRQDLQQTQTARSDDERRVRELREQLVAQQQNSAALTAELERLRAQQSPVIASSNPAPEIATLFLFAPASRDAGATQRPPELNLTPAVKQVRLRLRLKNNDYSRHQAVVEQVGGSVIWTQKNLKAKAKMIEVVVPAGKLAAGDYILTLSGLALNGEVDDLAKPFFRVRKR